MVFAGSIPAVSDDAQLFNRSNDINMVRSASDPGPGRVVDILEACGAFDPGSNPGRDVFTFVHSPMEYHMRDISTIFSFLHFIVHLHEFWSSELGEVPIIFDRQ